MRTATLLALLLATPVTADEPSFVRDVIPTLGRLGCNGGTCHGAVQGQNGFRLSLFGADPAGDFTRIVREDGQRRVDRIDPSNSLLLRKATGRLPHGGGRVLELDSPGYQLLRDWIAAGSLLDDLDSGRVVGLSVEPSERALRVGESYELRVTATYADDSTRDVTQLCSFESRDPVVASVTAGRVRASRVGDTSIVVRYGAEPVIATVVVSRPEPAVAIGDGDGDLGLVDRYVVAKLRRLNLPPSPGCDDATFLRRASLDVAGRLPTPDEVRDFLADESADKRSRKVDALLDEPAYAALWTLKFCDWLGASEYGVYADGLAEHFEAPRFQAWVRARLEENTPYDEFAERIVTATSREGRSLEEWAEEIVALQEGYNDPERPDLQRYAERRTLDVYWQRKASTGVEATLQVAHTFLGLRLECAQCHRHPHDVWQQEDLLDFANFFTRVRKVGFQGRNEKRYPAQAALFKEYVERGKQLEEEAKQLKSKGKPDEQAQKRIRELETRGKTFQNEVAKRILHAEVVHLADEEGQRSYARVASPLGEAESKHFRLLGETEPIEVDPDEDPRTHVARWMRRPDNPFFARAIVNRVWADYMGRGIVEPADDLSPLNPPSHPGLLDALAAGFVENGYDLKWLHRTIVTSDAYQRSSMPTAENRDDRGNYATFALRRLPAEVLLDAVNSATGATDDMDMKYWKWPDGLRTVEIPYTPRNQFVAYFLEQFGRPERNSAVQCDCERDSDTSILQVLSLANHPRILGKIDDPNGRVAALAKSEASPSERIDDLYLATLGRFPESHEREACLAHVEEVESAEAGLRGVAWSLINTREFLLQH